MSITALVAAVFGVVSGSSVTLQVVKRRWRKVTAFCAIDAAALLNIVTFGHLHHSHAGRQFVLIATVILFSGFLLAESQMTFRRSRQAYGAAAVRGTAGCLRGARTTSIAPSRGERGMS
ncbi:MAG TPA: hypothetical protein VMI73_14680 [Trebonia sp.]|nr:hypothetical protein [Trebonia sp.]